MTAKRKIYLTVLVFVSIFAVLITFGVLPQIRELKKVSQNLVFQKNKLNLFQNQLASFEDFKKNYILYQPNLEKIKKSFIDPKIPIDFIEFLERESKKEGVQIKIYPLSVSPAKTDPWKSIGFRILVGGTFPNCLRFLGKIEQSSYLFEIFQANIERIGKERQKREFENLSSGDVYFQILLKAFSGKALEKKKK